MSTVEADVFHIRKQLEKLTDPDSPNPDSESALDLLKALSKLKVNLNILTTTRIGMTVNTLRKSSTNEEVIALAKSLIKTWKKFVPENSEKKEKKIEIKKEQEEVKKKQEKELTQGKQFPARPQPTHDEVRLRFREMLCSALKVDGSLPDGTCKSPDELAELIEETIYNKFKNTDMKYKNHVRSRLFNLKDKKNPALRENVLCGVISAEKLAEMSSEEMASDEVKSQRQAFVKAGIDASQLAQIQGTKTDLLKCGKCGKRNCTYNQIQTRSADEPMTTFVLCLECGNRWKFC